MKHLKKFNESKSDYYTVTNGIADKVIDFNISNFNIIKSRLRSHIKCELMKHKDIFDYVLIQGSAARFEIFEGDDEWFYVSMRSLDMMGNPHHVLYFTCDQLDGLFKLLEDKDIANIRRIDLNSVEISSDNLKEIKSKIVPNGWFWRLRDVTSYHYWYKVDRCEWVVKGGTYLSAGINSGYVADIFQLKDNTFIVFSHRNGNPHECKNIDEVVNTLNSLSK